MPEIAKPHICIVAPNAYGALTGGKSGHVGGAEHQTTLTAKWLVKHGFPVSLVVWDYGQKDMEFVDGVRVVNLCPPDAGIPGLRFFHPRLSSLYSAIRRANADIYYHNSCEHITGILASWCRNNRRGFVYSAAHDDACDAPLIQLSRDYERALYKYGLRKADLLIVQTEHQKKLLKRSFGLDSSVLPMPCPGPTRNEYTKPAPPAPPRIVWVGRAVEIKRMEWFFQIAEKSPQINFEVAAANISNSYADGLRKRANQISNLKWLGAVARSDMPALYKRSSALCCTSVQEGFPNTFLEAWSYGIPLVTSFDPDGLVARLQLGLTANTVDEFVQALGEITRSHELWEKCSVNARKYYEENHMLDVAMQRFADKFMDVYHRLGATPVSQQKIVIQSTPAN